MFEDLCKCSECPLRKSKEVLGSVSSEIVGDEDQIEAVFIGISPAHYELQRKRLMTGPSGKLGRETAEKVGYENYAITNTMLCYYPEEATSTQIQKAIECCRPRLDAELEYWKEKGSKLIVTMGGVPTAAILKVPEVGIMGMEGCPINTDYGQVLPVRQPAAVLRRTDEYQDFKAAMENGIRILDGTFHELMPVETVIVTRDNLWEVLERIERAGEAVVDLETTKNGFFPYARDPDKIRCIALAVEQSVGYIIPWALMEDPEVYWKVKKVLESIRMVAHNGMFDCGFLFQEGIYPTLDYDTMLAHYLIDEREYAHGLKSVARRFLGAPDWESELKKYLPTKKASYDLIPDEVLFPYAARDVCYTLPLKEIFERQVPRSGNGVFSKLLMPCANMFNQIRHTGIRINIEELMQLDTKLEGEYSDMERELREMVGWYINPNSPQEVASYLYDQLGLPVHPQLGRTTSKKALRPFMDMDEVAHIIQCREFSKLRGTYLRGLANFVDYTWRIHPFTKLFGAVTGRISTEDPSIMNITKKGGIKTIYLPEEGEDLVDLDLSGGELRCYAAVTRDEQLIRMIKHGDEVPQEDPHNTVAAAITQRTGRAVLRGPAKTGVFGRMYGRGKDSFKAGFGVDDQGADEVIGIIDEMIPTLPKYNAWVRKKVLGDGELVSFFGRRRRFPLVTPETRSEAFRQAGNFVIQSMCSDVNLFAMLHMWDIRHETGATPMFPVHDSVVFSLNKEGWSPKSIQLEIERYTTELTGGYVPFKAASAVGPDWGHTEKVE